MPDPKTLRIVHVTRTPVGGIFRHILDVASGQAARGHDVGIVCDSTTGGARAEAALAAIVPQMKLGVSRFPMQRELGPADVKGFVHVSRHLASLNPDVLHGHGAKGGAFVRLMSAPAAIRVYTPHGGSLHYGRHTLRGIVYGAIERRYGLGFILALDQPFGIGPLQFSKYFPEDTHNSFLNAFMSGGWLSGACYPALIALTLVFGFRAVFVRTPWQQTTITVFAAFFGVVTESFIIDIDHWRHTFLLIGVMWGLIAAARRHSVRSRALAEHDHLLFDDGSPALARPGSPSYTFARRSVAQPG